MMETSPASLDDGLSAFVAARPRLFGIAQRMLGSAFDAEDVVQDVWLRWQTTDRSVVRSAPAFLVTMTQRLAINVVQSARARRETHFEPGLPEPADAEGDPGSHAERGEALERAVDVLLDRLSPAERTAYVLGEAFDYDHPRIADVLRVSAVNARQIARRARKHLAAAGRPAGGSIERRSFLEAFVRAAQTGELAALETLLSANGGAGSPSPSQTRSPRRRVGSACGRDAGAAARSPRRRPLHRRRSAAATDGLADREHPAAVDLERRGDADVGRHHDARVERRGGDDVESMSERRQSHRGRRREELGLGLRRPGVPLRRTRAATARSRVTPRSIRFSSTWTTVVMVLAPPVEPSARNGLPSRSTIVGAMLARGRFPAAGRSGSGNGPCVGVKLKSVSSLLSRNPRPGTTMPLPPICSSVLVYDATLPKRSLATT